MTLPSAISDQTIADALRFHQQNKILNFYPETGPLRRELYAKHMRFFEAGATHGERLAISANRVGKTEGLGAYETTLHATGKYPPWWRGRRFDRPINAWVAGKTGETTRDVVQTKLLGKIERSRDTQPGEPIGLGTGIIPAKYIVSTTPKAGIPQAIDTVWIKHASGGNSVIGFKSYGKDRDSFEGTEKDLIWLDEEPPSDVAQECSVRLMSTVPGQRGGLMIITFTPIEGYTEVVQSFLESTDPDKFYIQIGWPDAPHLTPDEIEKMRKKFPPHQLQARSEGQPTVGEGAIYPIDIETLLVDDFPIPEHWPRAFSLDVGKTAVLKAALNRDTDCLYFYWEYYSEEYNTLLHAAAIKGPNDQDLWMPGVADPASLGSSQVDGQKLFNIYTQQHKLDLMTANNAVEAGIEAVWQRMISGRLKAFRSLSRWKNELGRYHRRRTETALGESTKVVKKNDHLMDSMRYMVSSGISRMKTRSVALRAAEIPNGRGYPVTIERLSQSWMA